MFGGDNKIYKKVLLLETYNDKTFTKSGDYRDILTEIPSAYLSVTIFNFSN